MGHLLDIQPQVGAVAGDYVPNHMNPNGDTVNPNDRSWPPLVVSQAVNFVSAEPVLIVQTTSPKPGEATFPLYRVWGDPAWDVGGYWTCAAPADEKAFYGEAAVQWDWNSGRYAAELHNDGAATFVKAWKGPAARQPAKGLDDKGHATEEPIPGYYLPGGVLQIYMPNGTLPWIDSQRTPWNLGSAPTQNMAEPAEIQTIPTLNPGSAPGPEHYMSLAALLRTLAALLTVADAKPALLQTQPMRLIEQARLLNSTADVLRIHVTYFSDAAAKDRSKLIAQSLVFIARYVDTWALPPKYAAPINGVIEKIVQLALAISAGR